MQKTEAANWLSSLWGTVSIAIGYGLAHSALRLAISSNLPQDDVTSNILAQTLELGYTERQPPLHEWLVWCMQRVTGPTLPSFLIIKYGLLAATIGFMYLAAKRVFDDSKWVALSALSPLLLYQIGWNLHEGVTQTMVLICAVVGSFWAFMRLVERGSIENYFLFGIFLGFGFLSKYSFAGFLVALAASAMLQPAIRAPLVSWRILLSVAVATAITAPFLVWLVSGHHDLIDLYGHSVAPQTGGRLKATLIGLGLSLYSPLAFLFPLVVILPLCFPRMLRTSASAVRQAIGWDGHGTHQPNWEMLLLHITLAGFLVLILGAIFTGASHYLERYMHPFFLLTPLWLMAMARRSETRPRQVKALVGVLIGAIAFCFALRTIDLVHNMEPSCTRCRVATPYDGLALALRERGFQSGTIIANDRHDAGNLRRLFPDARVVCLRWPAYGPPMRPRDLLSTIAVVWKPKGAPIPRGAEEQLAQLRGDIRGAPELIQVPGRPFLLNRPPLSWEWMILAINSTGNSSDDSAPKHFLPAYEPQTIARP
jgi:4-amino-4-deoxy-L-arabinose transferase-like glycosyltransferase